MKQTFDTCISTRKENKNTQSRKQVTSKKTMTDNIGIPEKQRNDKQQMKKSFEKSTSFQLMHIMVRPKEFFLLNYL